MTSQNDTQAGANSFPHPMLPAHRQNCAYTQDFASLPSSIDSTALDQLAQACLACAGTVRRSERRGWLDFLAPLDPLPLAMP